MSSLPIVIIAEPDPMISSVLRVEFTHLGFTVLLAGEAQEAEDYAALTQAQLVVLDLGRLHLRVYEACARIRRLSGYAARPIVLTAKDLSEKVKTASRKAGATTLLTKPYSVNDLFEAVKPHLEAGDVLLNSQTRGPGVGAAQEWLRAPPPAPRSAAGSALTRNGLLLPIVRGTGATVPLMRKR